MTSLRFDVRVANPTEPAAQQAMDGTLRLASGDRAGAEQLYRDAGALPMAQGSSLVNLAALGVALGDSQGARGYAMRALQLDRANADAWVNLGAASWNLDMRRDAAQATHRALELVPGLEAAALNYGRMLHAVARPRQQREMLELAVGANPGAWRLRQALAEHARLSGDPETARRYALEALAVLRPGLQPTVDAAAAPPPRNEAADAAASAKVQQVLFAVHDALGAAGLPFHLIGGTLLAIHRDGRPFPHDKDVDLGLPFDCDREAVAAALAQGFKPVLVADSPHAAASREYVMGFIHEATGLGVDLMFVREQDGVARFELGWPDRLACEMPRYPLQPLHWAGRDWQVPAPPARYLDAIYGPDWSGEADSRGFDRRWFDTQVSNPSRTPESLPRAVTLVLLRLLHALHAGQWAKAQALCMQILAREPLAEVQAVLALLDDARSA